MSDFQFIVQDQNIVTSLIEQLNFQLPLLNVYLVYEKDDRQHLIQTSSENKLVPWDDLASAQWWQDDFLPEQVHHISLNQDYQVYVYPFKTNPDLLNYLCAITASLLNKVQQNYLQHQGKLIAQYLSLSSLCHSQQAQIHNLKQATKLSEHQLRHLIGLIGLCAENLYLGLENNPLQQQAEIIKETITELRHHLHDLITGEQSQNPHLQTHDLQIILRESIKNISLSMAQKQLTIDYPDTPAIAIFDPWQIKQVFDNILHNAIYYSPVGAKINCSWQVFQQEIIIEISDRGSGFSSQALQKALSFDYSEREGGTGLGLAIANKIILAHQGRLWIENLPYGGAQVSFTLPR